MDQLSEQEAIQQQEYSLPYHFKDLVAQGYKPLKLLEYTSKLQMVASLMEPFQGQRVLDAGCGDGRLCYELRHQNLALVGVDYSPQALAFAQAFNYGSGAEFFCQDLRALDLPYRFACITLLDTLEHLPHQDIPNLLERLHRHLEPGGRLIVTVPTPNTRLNPKHFQHFDQAALEEVMGGSFKLVWARGFFRKRHKFLFSQMRSVIGNLWPLLDKVGLLGPLVRAVTNYFNQRVVRGRPDQCMDLVAVFNKA